MTGRRRVNDINNAMAREHSVKVDSEHFICTCLATKRPPKHEPCLSQGSFGYAKRRFDGVEDTSRLPPMGQGRHVHLVMPAVLWSCGSIMLACIHLLVPALVQSESGHNCILDCDPRQSCPIQYDESRCRT